MSRLDAYTFPPEQLTRAELSREPNIPKFSLGASDMYRLRSKLADRHFPTWAYAFSFIEAARTTLSSEYAYSALSVLINNPSVDFDGWCQVRKHLFAVAREAAELTPFNDWIVSVLVDSQNWPVLQQFIRKCPPSPAALIALSQTEFSKYILFVYVYGDASLLSSFEH